MIDITTPDDLKRLPFPVLRRVLLSLYQDMTAMKGTDADFGTPDRKDLYIKGTLQPDGFFTLVSNARVLVLNLALRLSSPTGTKGKYVTANKGATKDLLPVPLSPYIQSLEEGWKHDPSVLHIPFFMGRYDLSESTVDAVVCVGTGRYLYGGLLPKLTAHLVRLDGTNDAFPDLLSFTLTHTDTNTHATL
jgi:hypothetical protein